MTAAAEKAETRQYRTSAAPFDVAAIYTIVEGKIARVDFVK